MSKTKRAPFMDREVELRVVPVGVLIDAAEMINEGKSVLDATFLTLCASAHWVDTGKRVFKDRDDCRATPSDHMGELMTLAREAGALNRPDFAQLATLAGDAPAAPAANGSDGPVVLAPSL